MMARRYKPKSKSLPTKYAVGFLQKLDGRQELTKRLSFAFNSVASDAGGLDVMPYARRALCERFAFLEEFLRQIEVELVKGGAVERADLLGRWVQAVNSMSGLAKLLNVADPNRPRDWLDTLYSDPESPETAINKPIRADSASNGAGPRKSPRTRERLPETTPGDLTPEGEIQNDE